MKSKTIAWVLAALCSPVVSYADEPVDYKPAYTPWYTGVLLSTAAGNAAPGQLFIQPFYNALFRNGDFNGRWKFVPLEQKQIILAPQLLVQWGLTNRLDFTMIAEMVTSMQGGVSSTLFADFYTAFGIQILRQISNTWVPDFRIEFNVTFPTGKYDRAIPSKLETDISGVGAYEIGAVFAIGKSFYYFPNHPFRLLWNIGFSGFSDADVHGLSVYGGIPETTGVAHPSTKFFTFVSGEWSITQRWVLGLETYFGYLGKDRFVGQSFFVPFNFTERMRFFIIPELEYNWSQNLGIVGGVQCQFLGNNQSAFTNLILSLVYCY